MKKLRELFIVLSGLLVMGTTGFAQGLDRPIEFDHFVKPQMAEDFYVESMSKNEGDLSQLDYSSGRSWRIWCVIEDTPIVPLPGSIDRSVKLKFGEEALVLEWKRQRNGEGALKNWLKIETIQKDTGWVQASNMQLASWCLQTEAGVGRKALVVRNLERGAPINEDLPESQLYHNPGVKRSDRMDGHTAGRFRVLYIMKESQKAWLVSNSPKLESSSDLRGWIPKTNMVEWQRRVAYGPEFNTAVNNRFQSDREIFFFETRSDASRYMRTGDSDKSSNKTEILPNGGELIPDIPAFPFIGKSTLDANDPLRELLLITGSSMEINQTDIEIREKIKVFKKKLQNVHVYFIVDATASMKRYYSDIAEAIYEYTDWADRWNSGRNVNMEVGFGVYRDYADAPQGNDVETVTRRRFNQSMKDNIDKMDCSSKNPKTPEAVYNGILQNIENFNVDPNASNVFVIIGDEGNHENDPPRTFSI